MTEFSVSIREMQEKYQASFFFPYQIDCLCMHACISSCIFAMGPEVLDGLVPSIILFSLFSSSTKFAGSGVPTKEMWCDL